MIHASKERPVLVKVVEGVRILGTGAGFCLAYGAWNPEAPDTIRILALTFAIAMCGTCAFEGIFLSRATALEKGYASSGYGRINPYHIQNTMWFVAATIVGIAWGLGYPDATQGFLVYVALVSIFFLLSASNHACQAVRHENRTWQNLNRPFLTLAMVGGGVPIMVSYL